MIVCRLREILTARGESVLECARESGVHRTALHNLYHNRMVRYDGPELDKLCAYLGVDVGDLLEYEPDSLAQDRGDVSQVAAVWGKNAPLLRRPEREEVARIQRFGRKVDEQGRARGRVSVKQATEIARQLQEVEAAAEETGRLRRDMETPDTLRIAHVARILATPEAAPPRPMTVQEMTERMDQLTGEEWETLGDYIRRKLRAGSYTITW